MVRYILFTFLILIVGCVETRDPRLMDVSQEGDDNITCEQITIEYGSNTDVATAKITKNDEDDVQDCFLCAIVWPGLADFKNADGNEGNALLDRNIRLKKIAESKGCDVSSYPEQPERYDW